MNDYTKAYEHCDSEEGVVIEHQLIPAGDYVVRYQSHELHEKYHGFGDKLVVEFVVVEGEYQGIILKAFYNVRITPQGFEVRGGTRYLREMRRLFPTPSRSYPVRLLEGKTILAAVRTVKQGTKKRRLCDDEQYSVIDALVQTVETTTT